MPRLKTDKPTFPHNITEPDLILPGATFPKLALSKMAGTRPAWLFIFNLNETELKMHVFIRTSDISSMQQLQVAGGYCTGQCRHRTFPSSPEVPLLSSTGLNIHY